MACHHVSALHDAKEKWQGAPLLESGRKPPSRWWAGGPAAGALSRRDQQCQREVWRKSIEVFEDGRSAPRTVALFAEEQTASIDDEQVIQVRLKDLEVRNARQWGGCWLVRELYGQLKLDQFWAERLPPGRKGTRWDLILQRYVHIVLLNLAVSGVCIDTGLIVVLFLSSLVRTSV
jgi:hypothetical protein